MNVRHPSPRFMVQQGRCSASKQALPRYGPYSPSTTRQQIGLPCCTDSAQPDRHQVKDGNGTATRGKEFRQVHSMVITENPSQHSMRERQKPQY